MEGKEKKKGRGNEEKRRKQITNKEIRGKNC